MEEVLYETQSDLNFHEFKKFEQTIEKKTVAGDIIAGIASAALWSLGVYLFIRRNPVGGGIAIAGGIALIIIYLALMGLRAHRLWNRESKRKNITTKFKFYEDRLEAVSSYKKYEVAYSRLYSVIETPGNFYIMVGPTEGLIVIKSKCESGLIDKLHGLSKVKEHI